MRCHNISCAAQRPIKFFAVLFIAVCLVGCGSKSQPTHDAQSTPGTSAGQDSDEVASQVAPTPSTESAEQVESQASSYVGLNWSGPKTKNSADKAASEIPFLAAPARAPISRPSDPSEALPSAKAMASVAEQPRQTGIGNMVEVFYATDRLPTAALMPSTWRTFAPVGVVWMICATLFIGFSATRRFTAFWLVGCGLAVCLGMMVFHASIIRWQQYSRLAHNAETRFSAVRDSVARDYPLHLGSARVSLPSSHKPGRFEQPKLYQFEFVESVDKHIVLHSLQERDSSTAWFDELSKVAEQSARRDSFLFIHGYNVRFIDALKRTAQLACDLELEGPAICYSWPSRGDVAYYAADEASVSWSAPHFEQLLLDLRARTKCQRVHVVAHSMGNRALLEAIERIDAKLVAGKVQNRSGTTKTKIIDSLVMAAPDVDLAEFTTRYVEPLRNTTQHTTLYFSDNDRALLLSAGLHGAPRLGLLRDHLQAFAGIESVYVGSQSKLTLGHSYYGDDPAVIEDLKSLLRDGRSAGSRELLRSATNAGGQAYWKIDRTLQAQLPAAQTR